MSRLLHCGPVGEEGMGDRFIPQIAVGVVHERFEERKDGPVCVVSYKSGGYRIAKEVRRSDRL